MDVNSQDKESGEVDSALSLGSSDTTGPPTGPQQGSVISDSGVLSNSSVQTENLSGPIHQQNQESKPSGYVTSTPKKNAGVSAAYVILASQDILDDPLLSSIDEDLTGHKVDALSSEDEDDNNYTNLYETRIRAHSKSPLKSPATIQHVNISPTMPKIRQSQSFSGISQDDYGSDFKGVKKNLFDIPVSPKLKNKVRERLYTLVNSIDGYEGKVKLNCEEDQRKDIYQARPILDSKCCEQCKQLACCHHIEPCVHDTKRIGSRVCNHSSQDQNSCAHQCSLHNDSTVRESKTFNHRSHELDTSINQHSLLDHSSTSILNRTSTSALNTSASERYGAAMSNILTAQMRTLHIHQEQLTQEKISLALEKQEQEMNNQVLKYQDKLELMVQMVGELEGEVRQLQRNLKKQKQEHHQEIRQLEERQAQQMATVCSEAERKLEEGEARIKSSRKEIVESSDRKISEVLSATEEKTAAVEKQHQEHIRQLTSVISRLRADKRELEISLGYISPTPYGTSRRNSNTAESEDDGTKANIEKNQFIQKDSSECDSVVWKVEVLREEVEARREEAGRLRRRLDEVKAEHQQQLGHARQEGESRASVEAERLRTDTEQTTEKLHTTISHLQHKLSRALSQNVELEQRLSEIGWRERDLTQRLSAQNSRLNELAEYRVSLEKDRESSIRQEAREEARQLLSEMGAKYEELVTSLQHHYKAQIDEYREAVRVLKYRIRMMKGNNSYR